MRDSAREYLIHVLGLEEDDTDEHVFVVMADRLLNLEEEMSQANTHLRAVQHALTEINPGWEYGAHFHCTCAVCS